MIYILTGVAKSGKSLVAQEIMKRYQISIIQTDHIMMMLNRGNPKLSIDIDASDSTVSYQIEPYIKALIDTLIENKKSVLFEGVHFLTRFARDLIKQYPHQIKIIYLVYEHMDHDTKAKELLEHASKMENLWFLSYDKNAYQKLIQYLVSESKRIADECRINQIPYLEVTDIIKQTDEIIDCLFNE